MSDNLCEGLSVCTHFRQQLGHNLVNTYRSSKLRTALIGTKIRHNLRPVLFFSKS